MEKEASCNCKTGCQNRRCTCLRNNEPCDEGCGCIDCQNPLNGVDLEGLDVCVIQNIHIYKALTEEHLALVFELPCGDTSAMLEELLKGYDCQGCEGTTYRYSFCWDMVVQEDTTWHCEICGTCRDWREWHCDNCNNCTYGVTFSCEHCGSEGRYSRMFG